MFLPIVVSNGVLQNSDVRDEIVGNLARSDLDGYLVWVDCFDETEVGSNSLQKFLSLVRSLRKRSEQEIINLHGGYFSILAAGTIGQNSISGVAHGPEFGEHRGVVPVGGGIPRAKFYIPSLHSRVPYREAATLLSSKGWLKSPSDFFQNVCACPECKKVIGADIKNFTTYGDATAKLVRRDNGFVRMEFPTSAAKQQCLRHYLERKAIEYKFADNSRDEIIKDLQTGYTAFIDLAPESSEHLAVWAKALADIDF